MSAYVLLDVSAKQSFIFRDNELKLILRNSYVIKSITEKLQPKERLTGPHHEQVALSSFLESGYPGQYEFVYSGGGNSIIRFDTVSGAESFIQTYTLLVLKTYPELELYISKVDVDSTDTLSPEAEQRLFQNLHREMDRLKDRRHARFRRISYGVEQIDKTGRPILKGEYNPEIGSARDYLSEKLWKQLRGSGVKLTNEIQKYRNKDEESGYIGIIAIDGNKMGDMVKKLVGFEQLGKFSEAIESIYLTAVAEALKKLELLPRDEGEAFYATPIVMAGDDLCLIVKAKYAIATAYEILCNIEQLSHTSPFSDGLDEILDKEERLTACAGVTIVKLTYPFYEAVRSAESLCEQAKEALHKGGGSSPSNERKSRSLLEWEIVQGQIRPQQAYEEQVRHGRDRETFRIRPLAIGQSEAFSDGIVSFEAFDSLVQWLHPEKNNMSSSFLERVRHTQYSGWEMMKQQFDYNHTGDGKKLTDQVRQIFSGAYKVEAGTIICQDEGGSHFFYLMGDAIEAIDFWTKREHGGKANVSMPD